jgi:hypothetical protein
MKIRMKHMGPVLAIAAIIALPGITCSQTMPFSGGTYSQDFNGLDSPTAGSISAGTDGPFRLDDLSWQTNSPPIPWVTAGMNGWQILENGGSGFAFFSPGNGSGTTSGAFSYGLNSDRALGSLAGAARRMALGVVVQNITGFTLDEATIAFTGEQWRLGRSGAANPADTLFFEYRVGTGTDISTAGGAFTSLSALNFVTPVTVGTVGALDGNAAANRISLSSTLSGLNWQAGQYLVLRWRDVDDTGSDHGMAIDDFTLTAIPEPCAVGLLTLGGVALAFARRSRRH